MKTLTLVAGLALLGVSQALAASPNAESLARSMQGEAQDDEGREAPDRRGSRENGDEERCQAEGECGWWWGYMDDLFDDEEEEEAPEPPAEPPPEETPPEEEEEARDCSDPDQWDAGECGFIDPGTDFDFQAQQRDALLRQAVMDPNNPNTVGGFQRYMGWAVNQSINMARTWQWNMMQDVDLNPYVQSPVTAYGIRAATRANRANRASTLQEIADQGGFLIWFTRSDCQFCHDMKIPMQTLDRNSPLEIWNAALDEQCMPGFEDRCVTAPTTLEPAQVLQVSVVPDLFLYMPRDDYWIRVAVGVDSVESIKNRIELFFGAVERAVAQGMTPAEGQQAPVDFSSDPRGRNHTGRGVPAEESQ